MKMVFMHQARLSVSGMQSGSSCRPCTLTVLKTGGKQVGTVKKSVRKEVSHGEKCGEELKLSSAFSVAASHTAWKTTSLEVRMLSKT